MKIIASNINQKRLSSFFMIFNRGYEAVKTNRRTQNCSKLRFLTKSECSRKKVKGERAVANNPYSIQVTINNN